MFDTPAEIFEKKISAKLKEAGKAKSIGAKVAFCITGPKGGNWWLDCTKEPGSLQTGELAEANVTVTMSDEDFVKLGNGQLKAEMAFMTGKLKVKGNMGLAIKLGQILS